MFRPIAPMPERAPIVGATGLMADVWLRWFRTVVDMVRGWKRFEATINPASVAAATTVEQTFTVAGLKTDMVAVVKKPTVTAGIFVAGARVSAVDTLAVAFGNVTAGAIDPPSETYVIEVVRG